jgi:imidazolonepropionase-like amidohydrolase
MTIVLRGGTLLDGTGRAPQPNAAVLIEGERIAAVGDAREVGVPPAATVLDCTGQSIMPGLIDCHDHLAHTNRDLNERSTQATSLTMIQIAENLRVTVGAGSPSATRLGSISGSSWRSSRG